MQNNIYKLYHRANDKLTYINKNSNHPPSILKQLTRSIEKRLPERSSKDIFDKSLIKSYQNALKDNGFSNDLHYVENNNNTNNSKWKRKNIWFNPSFLRAYRQISANFLYSFYQSIFLKITKCTKFLTKIQLKKL